MKTVLLKVLLIFLLQFLVRDFLWSQPVLFPSTYYAEIDFKITENNKLKIPVRLPKFDEPKWLIFDNFANTMLHADSVLPVYGTGSKIMNLPIHSVNGTKVKSSINRLNAAIELGNIAINNVTYMKTVFLPNEAFGVLGRNVTRSGVWFFDFNTNKLILANSIDKIDISSNCKVLDVKFNFVEDIIFTPKIEGKEVKLKLDFGYAGMVLLPAKVLNKYRFSDTTSKLVELGSLSGSSLTTKIYATDKRMEMGGEMYNVNLESYSSYESKNGLVGLGFFRQYRYLIIDYSKGKLYVGK